MNPDKTRFRLKLRGAKENIEQFLNDIKQKVEIISSRDESNQI